MCTPHCQSPIKAVDVGPTQKRIKRIGESGPEFVFSAGSQGRWEEGPAPRLGTPPRETEFGSRDKARADSPRAHRCLPLLCKDTGGVGVHTLQPCWWVLPSARAFRSRGVHMRPVGTAVPSWVPRTVDRELAAPTPCPSQLDETELCSQGAVNWDITGNAQLASQRRAMLIRVVKGEKNTASPFRLRNPVQGNHASKNHYLENGKGNKG